MEENTNKKKAPFNLVEIPLAELGEYLEPRFKVADKALSDEKTITEYNNRNLTLNLTFAGLIIVTDDTVKLANCIKEIAKKRKFDFCCIDVSDYGAAGEKIPVSELPQRKEPDAENRGILFINHFNSNREFTLAYAAMTDSTYRRFYSGGVEYYVPAGWMVIVAEDEINKEGITTPILHRSGGSIYVTCN